jgi:hypothetical protein
MNSAIWLLIYVFAVYRLAELIANDYIFEAVRRNVAKKAAAGGRFWKSMADWIHCPLCIGVWLSLPAAFLFAYAVLQTASASQIWVLWLGIAGAQYFLSSRNVSNEIN